MIGSSLFSIAVMGVDPGVKGGLAIVQADGRRCYLRAFRPSMTRSELVATLREAVKELRAVGSYVVYKEKVGYMRGDGGQGAFTFGRVDGILEGALDALGCDIRSVYPAQWQSAMDCLSGGNKNVTKKRASELFPNETLTHAVADALLIAEFGRRREAL